MKTTATKTENNSKGKNTPFFAPKNGSGFFQVQPKLNVGKPGDKYEQEADRVADQVMRMSNTGIQRKYDSREEEDKIYRKPLIQRKVSESGALTTSPEIDFRIAASRGSGRPLDKGISAEMGNKIGADFSGVNIHTDTRAIQLSQDLGAKAFTVGNDVYFNKGQYNPTSREGKKLMAHELVHVLQQKKFSKQVQKQSNQEENIEDDSSFESLKDEDLYNRYDMLVLLKKTIGGKIISKKIFEKHLELISSELSKRALSAGRTFSDEQIKKMKDYFETNATSSNPKNCIGAMNHGIKALLEDENQLMGSQVDHTMDALRGSGRAGDRVDIEFLDSNGRQTGGTLEPIELSTSVWDTAIEMAKRDVGWSVFGLSIMDGYHSVTLSLDNTDLNNPKIYWSDQWSSGGGWEEFNKSNIDDRIILLTQRWWNSKPVGKKPKTRVTLWRINN